VREVTHPTWRRQGIQTRRSFKKLGLKPGQAALLIGVPASVGVLVGFKDFARCERLAKLASRLPKGPFDYIHVFETEAIRLEGAIAALRKALTPAGMIWVSWPKKAAKVETTLNENIVRGAALANQLVDVKVCAIDEVWSGLKLVIPKSLR
jgi:hypothetical protein